MKKNATLLFSCIACMLLLGFGCKGPASLQEANKTYDKQEYHEAAEMYNDVYKNSKNKNEKKEAAYKMGISYVMYGEYAKAEKAFEKADKANYGPAAKLKMADAIKAQERYADAIIKYNEYLKENPTDELAIASKEGCESALKWKNEKTRYVVENFKKINTKQADFAPFFIEKEGLYFTSDREGGKDKGEYDWTGNYHTDIWVTKMKSRRGEINWENPVIVEGSVNTNFNDGVASFGNKGRIMYYTQCNNADGKGLTCKIYSATKRGKDAYEEPLLLNFNSDSFNCGQPCLSEDGKQLFFASDMPGGYGGHDLYVVNYVKRGNTWGDPINLGPIINTAKDEMYPYVHSDGTLYFASNGHMGIGGLDIFYTTGSGEEWSKPLNIKSPINSGGDDFAIWLAADKESGYFTSNRTGGRGNDDIYSFNMKPCEITTSVIVRDCKTKQILPNIEVYISNNKDTSEKVFITDKTGAVKFPGVRNTSYEIYSKTDAIIDGNFYKNSTREFAITNDECFKEYIVQLEMCPIPFVFTVEGILYGLDSADIRPSAAKILDDSVISVMNRFPFITIELGSHTDCRASNEYNNQLSQRRADSAVRYLISRGIDSARLTAKGYGETELRLKKCACDLHDYGNKICSEEEHQLNRRTTVKITGFDYKPKPKPGAVVEEPKPTPNNRPNPRERKPAPQKKAPEKKAPEKKTTPERKTPEKK